MSYMKKAKLVYYMRILSASAIYRGAIQCTVWNTFHMADFIMFWCVVTSTFMGSAGMCNIYDATPDVVLVEALFDRHNVNLTSQSALRHNRQHDSCTIDSELQTAPDRIYVKFNKWLFFIFLKLDIIQAHIINS